MQRPTVRIMTSANVEAMADAIQRSGWGDRRDDTPVGADLVRHRAGHELHLVGDDDWLESLREGDRFRIGRWSAPFDVVRRYLVTGQVEARR